MVDQVEIDILGLRSPNISIHEAASENLVKNNWHEKSDAKGQPGFEPCSATAGEVRFAMMKENFQAQFDQSTGSTSEHQLQSQSTHHMQDALNNVGQQMINRRGESFVQFLWTTSWDSLLSLWTFLRDDSWFTAYFKLIKIEGPADAEHDESL